jgi:hypothetical protein
VTKRGKKGVWPVEARPGRRRETTRGFRPEIYYEKFLQEEVRRLRFIERLSSRHFEAKKFWLDLRAYFMGRSSEPPRRA